MFLLFTITNIISIAPQAAAVVASNAAVALSISGTLQPGIPALPVIITAGRRRATARSGMLVIWFLILLYFPQNIFLINYSI